MTKPIDTNEIRGNLHIYEPLVHGTLRSLCDEIDRLRGVQTPPQGKTVEYRAVVYVDSYGNLARDSDEVRMNLGSNFRSYTVTATLPVPKGVKVVAEVEDGNDTLEGHE